MRVQIEGIEKINWLVIKKIVLNSNKVRWEEKQDLSSSLWPIWICLMLISPKILTFWIEALHGSFQASWEWNMPIKTMHCTMFTNTLASYHSLNVCCNQGKRVIHIIFGFNPTICFCICDQNNQKPHLKVNEVI